MCKIKSIAYVWCVVFSCVKISKAKQPKIELAFDVFLPPNGKLQNLSPIIFIHGLMDCRATWKYIAPVIANETGRKIYTVDMRNHGDSPWTEEMNFDAIGDDLDNFLVTQNISKAILVGHSVGGKGAITLALKQPEKVEKLIIEDMIVSNIKFIPQGVVSLLCRLLRLSLSKIPPGTDLKTAQNLFMKFVLKKLPDGIVPCRMRNFDIIPVKQEGDKYAWKTNIDGIEKSILAGNEYILEQDLTSYEPYVGETLFIYGTRSPFRVETDEQVLKYFPHAVKLGFKDATHLVHHEYTEDFIREVIEFIDRKIKPKKSECFEDMKKIKENHF